MASESLSPLLLTVLCAATSCAGRKFHYVPLQKPWAEAQAYCRENFAPAAVSSLDDLRPLAGEAASGAQPAWIGMYREAQNWQWSDGAAVRYYNWGRGLFCASADPEGYWEDSVCFAEKAFVCQTDSADGARTYTLVPESKTWAAAREHCRRHHSDLATVRSPADNEAARRPAQGGAPFWIGLVNEPWKWADGRDLPFRSWAPGEPDNGNGQERCVFVYQYRWMDLDCRKEKASFCCSGDFSTPVRERCEVMTEQLSWPDARTRCRAANKDLATLGNATENQQLFELLGAYGYSYFPWLGLYRGADDWRWVDGEGLGYSNWKTQLFCATSDSGGSWRDRDCGELHQFLCHTDSADGARTFTLVPESKTWAAAREHCRRHHSDLATVRSPADNEAARRPAQGGAPFWIGLVNEPWKWADGRDLPFRFWGAEPPSGGGGCVRLDPPGGPGARWSVGDCGAQLPFFCAGEKKRRVVLRVQLTQTRGADLNEEAVKQDLLNQMREQFSQLFPMEKSKLYWREEGGGVFYRKEESQGHCGTGV